MSRARHLSQACVPPPTPESFQSFIVYSTTGVYDPLEGPFPEGCSPEDAFIGMGLCEGAEDVFYRGIMQMNDSAVAIEEAKARVFFMQRFGLDPERLEKDGRAIFSAYLTDPRQKFVAHVFPRECVPSEGFQVRDGGHMLVVTDPEGVELGQEFEGQTAPVGTRLVHGLYNIVVTGPNARVKIMRFTSLTPSAPAHGMHMLNYEMKSLEWGAGLAQGLTSMETMEDGRMRAVQRTVLTFPALENP